MQLFSSWTGGDFLLFYTMLLVLAVAASWWIPLNLRPRGRSADSLDSESIAFLAGGPQRHAEAVLADLYARGGLLDAGGRKLQVEPGVTPASLAGRAVMSLKGSFRIDSVRKALVPAAEQIVARLRRQGLMAYGDQISRLRWLSAAPFAVLLLIGLYRERAGSALGEPTGGLIGLMLITAAAMAIRLARFDRRTTGGIETLHRLQDKAERLRRAPKPEEAALAVALFGTAVLVGTPWEAVHAMRQQGSGEASGSGDSDSDGGSGCGGGGCGGCGG